MKRTPRLWLLALTGIIFWAPSLAFSQARRSIASLQTQFSAEDESVKDPVAVPEGAKELLLKDESVREAMAAEEPPLKEFPDSWFSASVVHLGPSEEQDLVLVGKGPMLGANITQFWVFRQTARGYREVLTAHAHDLVIREAIWKGFHEIELLSATGVSSHTVILRFDGHSYRPYRDRWESTK